jgi:H+-transporting ATPase
MGMPTQNASAPPDSQGLTSAEAAARLATYGPNAVPERRSSAARGFLAKVSGPVPWMLEAALVLEIALRKVVEALIIVLLLLLNATISVVQERRARDALALLRAQLRVVSRVRRDGVWAERPAEEIVPGDLVHVRVGDFVPADLVLESGRVLLDESSLTGESAPVEAQAKATAYSGSVVRRGEATGRVTSTGARSYFGKTVELVGAAKTTSHLETLILSIVKYLIAVDGALAAAVFAGALAFHMALADVVPFVLMLLVASVPVALPATFTLAGALGALELSSRGVLVTRLAAIEEAAAMQVLCSDKTGTLTQNSLSLASRCPAFGQDEGELLRLAALASDEATQDPLDLAILRAAGPFTTERVQVTPFDPATKRAEALVRENGVLVRVVKGAPKAVASLVAEGWDPSADVARLGAAGERVLAVVAGPEGALRPMGLLGFLDPPREDAPALIRDLRALGVRVVMVTGDAAATAEAMAKQLGIGDRVGSDPSAAAVSDVLAGVLPEDKLRVVRALQSGGAVVGMTGDGVNDAPALKQAEVGIAVSTATDVAKAAASLVLTTPGLRGVVVAIETGRRIYQRMMTYTLNKIVKTFEVALFLTIGFFATGALVTTPRLVLLLLLTNDFVTMSIAGDRVVGSRLPDRWRVRSLVVTALALASGWLAFSLATLFVARALFRLTFEQTQTLAFLVLVFGGQANVYVVRERRRFWRSMPSPWMLAATSADLLLVGTLATTGTLMAAVPLTLVLAVLTAALAAALLIDEAKIAFSRGESESSSAVQPA